MMNAGKDHEHLERITNSKLSESENAAAMYHMYKDHKSEGGYRPVVSGCSSDSLGLSNILSEAVEAVAQSIISPFEVISSEDMLSRLHECNRNIELLKKENGRDWSLNDEMILLGTDVKSLFPSLSAEMTGKCVRNQFAKSTIKWENVDWKLVTLYVKLNEKYWKGNELSEIRKYLPEKISNI